MGIPQNILDDLKRAEKSLSSSAFTIASKEASRVFQNNIITIDNYLKFQDRINYVETVDKYIQNNSLAYLSREIPDLVIDFNNIASAQSVIQNISIPMEDITPFAAIKKMLPDISNDEAYGFINYLSEYPMLGYMEKVGKDIFTYIKGNKKVIVNNVNMFRIRKGEYGKSIPYTDREMIGSPYGISKQNRFNNIGIGVSYYSSKILKEEVDLKDNDRYTTIEVELINECKLLDVRANNIPIFFLCHDKADNKTENYSKQYLLPNYITDCAKKNGFDGIIYRSVINNTVNNYAFFDLSVKSVRIIKKTDCNWAT